jgi:hypothetical protein
MSATAAKSIVELLTRNSPARGQRKTKLKSSGWRPCLTILTCADATYVSFSAD